MPAPHLPHLDLALEEERAFIASLGGFTLEIAGARLVTHERIPVPRFNFVQDVRIDPARQAAFFERALDHYFQRALRPCVRVGDARHRATLAKGLAHFGFRPREEAHVVLLATAGEAPAVKTPFRVRPATPDELESLVAFWGAEREREELRRALEVAWAHPHPDERFLPLLAEREGALAAALIVHEHRGLAGIHGVATQPADRGQGAATALVREALGRFLPRGEVVAMHSDHRPLATRLGSIGFFVAAEYAVFDLPADAELAFPPVGPPAPPRWRPPRGAPPAG